MTFGEPAQTGEINALPENPLDAEILRDMKSIFGDSVHVNIRESADTSRHKKEVIIRTKLKDGLAEGGQDVVVTMHEPRIITRNYGQGDVSVRTYPVEHLEINGSSELLEDFEQLVFVPQEEMVKFAGPYKTDRYQNFDMTTESGRALAHIFDDIQAYASSYDDTGTKALFLQHFKSGDNLVALLHEQGHHDKGVMDDSELNAVYIQYVQDLNLSPARLAEIQGGQKRGIINRWIIVHNNEITADNQAMMRLQNSRYSQKWADAFPQDAHFGFVRVYKALEMLNVIGIKSKRNNWYQENLTEEQKGSLMSFVPPVIE